MLWGAVLKPNTGLSPLQFSDVSAPRSLATISMQQRESYKSNLETFRDGIRKQLPRKGTGTAYSHLRLDDIKGLFQPKQFCDLR